ncbi:hypothetical protein B0J14DRAFT_594991 [Halenospora varia]|nr:hypothetical protein B0J14DRAFT_594991 [Halenospora varia]
MAFLFACTSKPAQKSFDYNNWELITHAKFDGTCQDCFQATTLHLSFTDYEQTVDVGRRGIKDTEVVLIESVVSVHDRGKWISDIDIIKSLSSGKFLVAVMPPCDHSEQERKYSEDKAVERIVSIDNWEELLDAVEDATAIVRAHDNWLARLAATAISIQNKRKTIVLPSEICWECLRKSDIYNGKTLIC